MVICSDPANDGFLCVRIFGYGFYGIGSLGLVIGRSESISQMQNERIVDYMFFRSNVGYVLRADRHRIEPRQS